MYGVHSLALVIRGSNWYHCTDLDVHPTFSCWESVCMLKSINLPLLTFTLSMMLVSCIDLSLVDLVTTGDD